MGQISPHSGHVLKRSIHIFCSHWHRQHNQRVHVERVIVHLSRRTELNEEFAALSLQLGRQIRRKRVYDLLEVERVVQLATIIAPEAPQQGFPQHIFLDSLLIQITGVDHHIFVHDLNNARSKAFFLTVGRLTCHLLQRCHGDGLGLQRLTFSLLYGQLLRCCAAARRRRCVVRRIILQLL